MTLEDRKKILELSIKFYEKAISKGNNSYINKLNKDKEELKKLKEKNPEIFL